MTTHRTWTEEEDDAVIEMFCQGRSIDSIRLNLPRPETVTCRTANAINARMNLFYAQGKISIVRGDGIPREFDIEAEVEERVQQVLADITAQFRRDMTQQNVEIENVGVILHEMLTNLPTPIRFGDEEE